MRLLTAEQIRQAITMTEAIGAVREGFIALSEERVIAPLRAVLSTAQGVTLTMPAHLDGVTWVKVVSVYSGNRQQGLPSIYAMVLVLDGETGIPLALMEGGTLTALRTGAASGLATDLLARPDAKILGVIGSGVQARTQIEAVCAVRTITEIRVYSPNNAEKLAKALASKYPIRAVSSADEALADADVIVTATNSGAPVVHVVTPGTHINGIGSYTPHMAEIAASVVAQAKIVVDSRESAWAEAGDIIMARDQGLIQDVYGEIGEIAAGKLPGRTTPDEITFFKSVGNAVQDVVVARKILQVAQEQNLGTVFDF